MFDLKTYNMAIFCSNVIPALFLLQKEMQRSENKKKIFLVIAQTTLESKFRIRVTLSVNNINKK